MKNEEGDTRNQHWVHTLDLYWDINDILFAVIVNVIFVELLIVSNIQFNGKCKSHPMTCLCWHRGDVEV